MALPGLALGVDQPAENIFAVQSRASTPDFQLFLDLADDSSVAMTGPLFGPAGGVYGMAFAGGTVYATELDNASLSEYYLASIPHDIAMRGQGGRISPSPIGFGNVEGLAAIDGSLYASSLNFAAHRTTLVTIDLATGEGTAVGMASRNVMIVGLAYDPNGQTLYGVGKPFGAGEQDAVDDPSLFTIDPSTGASTLVGPLGATIEGLTFDADIGLVGSFDRLYSIDTMTGAATELGPTDFTDGKPDTFNGIYGLAAPAPEGAALCGDANQDGTILAGDALQILRFSVGIGSSLLWLCDVDSNGLILASDALAVLRRTVDPNVELNCPPAP